jgi:hypothetical protein
MLNMKFKADDYISLNVGLEHVSGEPIKKGDIVGVLITGSGTAGALDNVLGSATYNGNKYQGIGNKPGWASVALEGGAEVNIPAGIRPVAVGDTLYIGDDNVLSKTATGRVRFGKVTHLGFDTTTAIVKIVQ